MTRYLLDSNLLIALSHNLHRDYPRVLAWAKDQDEMLICPIVQGAMIRYQIRIGNGLEIAEALLKRFHDEPRFVWIPDNLDFDQANLSGIMGHRQVTDVYLTELALRHDALLATLDTGIAALRPDGTFLIQ